MHAEGPRAVGDEREHRHDRRRGDLAEQLVHAASCTNTYTSPRLQARPHACTTPSARGSAHRRRARGTSSGGSQKPVDGPHHEPDRRRRQEYQTPKPFSSTVYTANVSSVFDTPTIPNFTNCTTPTRSTSTGAAKLMMGPSRWVRSVGIIDRMNDKLSIGLGRMSAHGVHHSSSSAKAMTMSDTSLRTPTLLSVVAPVYDEEELIEAFVAARDRRGGRLPVRAGARQRRLLRLARPSCWTASPTPTRACAWCTCRATSATRPRSPPDWSTPAAMSWR